jgi:CubicO group peptidase (beta-lactamase class C family)
MKTDGFVAPGFEPVRDTFLKNFKTLGELGASFCAFHHGQLVVDLWGGTADKASGTPWVQHQTVPAYSVTKGLVATVLLLLTDRGILPLSSRLAEIWPALDTEDKRDITIHQWINHRSGLSGIDTPLKLDDFLHPDRVQKALVAQAPYWTPGTQQGYAATAFGMFAQELVRARTGRTLGQWLADEIAGPLGDLPVWIGLPEGAPQAATLYPAKRRTVVTRMVPETLFRNSVEGRLFRGFVLKPRSLVGRATRNPYLGLKSHTFLNQTRYQRMELPWMNGVMSARGLATIYGMLACGGTWNGRSYVSASAVERLSHRQSWSEFDQIVGKPIGFSQGFMKEQTHLYSPNKETFGHTGLGGAVGLADPKSALSMGYVMNQMDWRLRSPRALALCRSLYRCVERN